MGKEKRLVISAKHYPFEVYCVTCKHVIAYSVYQGVPGMSMTERGIINLDGNKPKAGDPIECQCPRFTPHQFSTRLRPGGRAKVSN